MAYTISDLQSWFLMRIAGSQSFRLASILENRLDTKAPGGDRFVLELIDKRSGTGSTLLAKDLNNDGAIDIVTSNKLGTFIF